MLEYNADTPTSLVEAASPQWFWMEDRFPGADQWNSLHERLVDAWKRQAALLPPGAPVHFAHSAGDELGEDLMTVAYVREAAHQAGLETEAISMEDIHPNLLPAYLDGPRELAGSAGYVAKPLLGREGAGVSVHEPGRAAVVREEACCYQEFAPLPDIDGNRVVLGAWVVEDEAAGLGIRESAGLVTDAYARFLPHVIL
jgi:glutathionylspermidine synthase